MRVIKIQSILGIVIWACYMALTIQPAFSKQKDSIGTVVAVRGNVIAVAAESNSRPLSLKAPIFLNDTIKTRNGRVQMMFKDHTLITLGRNSEIQITKYLWEAKNPESAMETRVQEGTFRIMGGAITRTSPKNFKTNTPSGTIGIRGSMYAGRVDGDSIFVIFQAGKGIYVQNQGGIVDITQPGFGTRVKDMVTPPEKPEKISLQELEEFEALFALSSSQETTDSGRPVAMLDSNLEQTPLLEVELLESEYSDSLLLTELFSAVDDIQLLATQDSVEQAMTPVGVEQQILFLLAGLDFPEFTPSTNAPASGIWTYQGEIKHTLEPTGDNHPVKFIVNWNNNRIFGFEEGVSTQGSNGFVFGTTDASGGISNMKLFGSAADPNTGFVTALTGSETFGQLYGTSQGGIGLAMEGYDYNIQNQTNSEFWSDIVAAKLASASNKVYTGTENWGGFFVGVSEDMTNPGTDRRIFHNSISTNFALTVNKDLGTISGSLSGLDFNDTNNSILSTNIGGSSTTSAFITDGIFAAEITDATINMNGPTGGLKTYGNFMVTANEAMLSDYTTWGYWEVAYAEPGSGADYHTHAPGSRWIAGVQASLPASFTGTYQGGARGVMIDASSQMKDLTGGTTNLNIDFTGSSTPVTGTIDFNEIDSPFIVETSSPGDLGAGGFNAKIAGMANSSVNGAFFGPTISGASGSGPAAVGGNFLAETGGIQYHGIFAGDLQ